MMGKERLVRVVKRIPAAQMHNTDTRRDLSQFGRATETRGGDILFHCKLLSFDVFARDLRGEACHIALSRKSYDASRHAKEGCYC